MSRWRDWVLELSPLFGLAGEIYVRDKTGDKAVRVVRFARESSKNEEREGEEWNQKEHNHF